jgi:multidrug efflux pump
MLITDISVKRPVFASVISLLLLAFGLIAFRAMPLRQYPDINPPVVSVETKYIGAAAEVVETRITQRIEDAISGIEGIRYLQSTSEEERSVVTIEFNLTRDVDAAANDVRDRVSRIIADLPEEADPPEIFKVDANNDVIMWLNLASTSLNQLQLTDYAERYLVDELSVVDGVAQVRVSGGRTYAMRIWLNPTALAARGLAVQDVEQALRAENIELPAGRIESKDVEYSVRLERIYQTEKDFANLVIGRGSNGALIRLQDVARIELGAEDERSEIRGNGEVMVGLGIIKQSTANTLDVARAIKKKIASLQASLPNGTMFYDSYDTSVFIEQSIHEVYETLIIAILLVIAIIYGFLGSVRATIIPAVTVPLSIIASFIVLSALGYSINLLTLLALILAIGLVVDDAIIMLENIQRRIDDGEPPLKAAFIGARQMAFAVIATTAVLMAVFIPITYLSGNVGRLFTEFAVAMMAAVGFSSVIALTLSPMLCANILKNNTTHSHQFSYKIDAAFHALVKRYERILHWSLTHANIVIIGLLGLLLLMGALFYVIPREFVPKEDRGVFFMRFNAPEGASYSYTARYAERMEKDLMPLVESGEATRILMRIPGAFGGTAVNTGLAIVVLDDWGKRRNVSEITASLMPKMATYEGVKVFPIVPQGLGQNAFTRPVEFVVGGNSYAELTEWRDLLLAKIAEYKGLQGVDIDLKETKPQFIVSIMRDRAAALGVSVEAIGRSLETFLASRRVTTMQDRGEEYDVMLEAQPQSVTSINDLLSLYVRSSTTNTLIQLANLVKVEEVATSPILNRYNRRRALTISANIAEGYALGEVLTFLENTVRETLPATATIDYKGDSLEFRSSSAQTWFVFAMALVIIFLVLAAQFESYIHPLTIMLTVPLALCGGLLGLWICGLSFNIYSQIGLLMLIGLAAKNGILIVEFANQLRDEGVEFNEAVRQSALLRLRPILMTSITTVMGAVPLVVASGAGAESRFVLGVVIVAGVVMATLFTLVVVPVAYQLIGRYAGSPLEVTHKLDALLNENHS